jgi:uncharacterized membrane protein (GlpM family)
MLYFTVKTLVTALVIAAISELSKRYSLVAGVLAAIPLTSILAFIWIYVETKDTSKIVDISTSIIWLIVPSITFFIALNYFLKKEIAFVYALPTSLLIMLAGYGVFIAIKNKLGY